MNWIDDCLLNHFWLTTAAACILLVGLPFLGFYLYDKKHPCIRSHREMVYHPPTYVMVGKVLMPIGGGTWEDWVCDERK